MIKISLKKVIQLIGILLFLSGIGYLAFWGVYLYKQKEANQESFSQWYTNDYLPSSFTAKVVNVNSKPNDIKLITISLVDKRKTLAISKTREAKMIIPIEVGDTLKKLEFSVEVLVKHRNGHQESLVLPFIQLE